MKLGVAGDAGGEVRRQGNRFVQRVRVQGLRMAAGGGQGLNAGAGDVVERVLFREGPAGSLGVRAQGQGLRVLGIELLDEFGPQHAGGAHFSHFHEVILALGPEEGKTRREGVNVNARLDPGADIFQAVRKGVGHFQVRRRAGLLHVVAGDGNGVELGHVLGGELKDVRNNPHGGIRRVNVGVAHHVFLENVILDRAGELVQRAALFLGGDDVESQHGQHGAVHGHGNGHFVQGNALEEDFHVQDGVHGHAGLAHVTHHAGWSES